MLSARVLLHSWGGQLPLSATTPEAAWRSRPSHLNSPALNIVTYDHDEQKRLTRATQPNEYNDVVLVISQSRRVTTSINFGVFIECCLMALKSGNYVVRNFSNTLSSLTVKLDLSRGSSAERVLRQHPVDILSLKTWRNAFMPSVPVINMHPELLLWTERVLAIHAGTHVPCVNARCPGMFRKRNNSGKVRCVHCNTDQCVACKTEWAPHAGMSCVGFKLSGSSAIRDPCIAQSLLDGLSQKCGTGECDAIIERTTGCNAMLCIVCNHYFCWSCGTGGFATESGVMDHIRSSRCAAKGLYINPGDEARVWNYISLRNIETYGPILYETVDQAERAELAKNLAHLPVGDIEFNMMVARHTKVREIVVSLLVGLRQHVALHTFRRAVISATMMFYQQRDEQINLLDRLTTDDEKTDRYDDIYGIYAEADDDMFEAFKKLNSSDGSNTDDALLDLLQDIIVILNTHHSWMKDPWNWAPTKK